MPEKNRLSLKEKVVVELGLLVHLAVVDVQGGEVQRVSQSGGEVKSHRVDRISCLRRRDRRTRRGCQLEDGKSPVQILRQLFPGGCRESEAVVEPVEVSQSRNEAGAKVTDLVDCQQ